jgi:hypothetical protein
VQPKIGGCESSKLTDRPTAKDALRVTIDRRYSVITNLGMAEATLFRFRVAARSCDYRTFQLNVGVEALKGVETSAVKRPFRPKDS